MGKYHYMELALLFLLLADAQDKRGYKFLGCMSTLSAAIWMVDFIIARWPTI